MADNPYKMSGTDPSDLVQDGADEAAARPEAARAPGGERPYKSQINRANVIMAGLFVAAGALVYGLTLRKGTAEASAEVQQVRSHVTTALKRFEATRSFAVGPKRAKVTTKDLLQRFGDQITRRQIPMSALRKDPFAFVPPSRLLDAGGGLGDGHGPSASADPKDRSRREVQVKFDALRLQGIQSGRNGVMAIISNNLVTPGQKIECFTVRRIDEKSVTLTWEDEEFLLKMP